MSDMRVGSKLQICDCLTHPSCIATAEICTCARIQSLNNTLLAYTVKYESGYPCEFEVHDLLFGLLGSNPFILSLSLVTAALDNKEPNNV